MRILIKYLIIPFVFTTANAEAEFYLSGKLGSSVQGTSERKLSVSEYNVNTNEPASAVARLGRETSLGMLAGIGVGYNLKQSLDIPLRLEVEYLNRKISKQQSHKKGLEFDLLVPNHGNNELVYTTKTKSQQLMLNTYIDCYTNSGFNPFIIAGVGRSVTNTNFRSDYRVFQNKGTIESVLKSKMNYIWSLGVGVAKEINTDWVLNLGYSFTHAGNLNAQTKWISKEFGFEANLRSESSIKIQYHDFYLSLAHKF